MNAHSDTLTVEQAYQVMLAFLEREVDLTECSDLADLLAGYRLDGNGQPRDPALWDEWTQAVAQVMSGKPG